MKSQKVVLSTYIERRGKLEKYMDAARISSNEQSIIYLSEEILPDHLKHLALNRNIVCNRCWLVHQFTPWRDLFQNAILLHGKCWNNKKMIDIDK